MQRLQPPADLKTAHWRHMFLDVPARGGAGAPLRPYAYASRKARTPVHAAACAALVALVLLLALSPPFVQERRTDISGMERGRVSAARLLVWGVLVFIIVLISPLFLRS